MALAVAAVAAPLAAVADSPAVAAPTLPAPFIGAPMNDSPNGGEFTVNFDDQGRYLGTGSAPEHYASFDLTQVRGSQQARPDARRIAVETGASNAVFASFQQRLRILAASQAALGDRR